MSVWRDSCVVNLTEFDGVSYGAILETKKKREKKMSSMSL